MRVALLVLVLAAQPARAGTWNARGQAAAAWIDTKDRVRVAVATGPGRFGAARTLASASADGAIRLFERL